MKINWSRNTGFVLLGIWLMATGLCGLVDLRFTGRDEIIALLALVAGGFIAFKR